MSESRISRKEETSEGVDGFWDAQGVAPMGLRCFYRQRFLTIEQGFGKTRGRGNREPTKRFLWAQHTFGITEDSLSV